MPERSGWHQYKSRCFWRMSSPSRGPAPDCLRSGTTARLSTQAPPQRRNPTKAAAEPTREGGGAIAEGRHGRRPEAPRPGRTPGRRGPPSPGAQTEETPARNEGGHRYFLPGYRGVFDRKSGGVLRHPPRGALCFVTLQVADCGVICRSS